jgi:phosphatidylserine/phosphatidylglycerophosphate/cardiolipin synthase-like enzyme
MKKQALAIANNDLVYLWWTYPEKIPECLGFTIHRIRAGREEEALPAFVGFTPAKKGAKKQWSNTDYWPIQSYQWKDLFVPEETEVEYMIIPVKGTPGKKLVEISEHKMRTNAVKATDTLGVHRVVFNRGIISTQALSGKLPKGKSGSPSAAALRKHIAVPGDKIRERLAGEANEALLSLFERARSQGGKCLCALYELTDPELVAALKGAAGSVEVILANADSSKKQGGKTVKIYDGTNAATRQELRQALGEALHDRLLPKGNYIGHNKFVVYLDAQGVARAVLTGSTNWTASGLCAQSNNVLILEDPQVAAMYHDAWLALLQDGSAQGAVLRAGNAEARAEVPLGPGEGTVRPWFSPNMGKKSKPVKDPPVPPDMAEVFQAIEEAKHGVLFLLFSAGSPSILQKIAEVSEVRKARGEVFFVRGAVSDARASGEFATRVYNDSLLKAPNRLITGIAGISDQYSYWEKELAKLGHAVIHDKVLVVDPFSDGCVVVTGSHNLGFKASYSNDENLCVIRGNRAMAGAYTSHVLDIVNHYNWRYKLAEARKKGKKVEEAYWDLDESDQWQDKYFKGHFLESRDLFFFPE